MCNLVWLVAEQRMQFGGGWGASKALLPVFWRSGRS
eukprot:SAG31_NODE_26519_length_440_cov_13.501466_2_plen_35_part_01